MKVVDELRFESLVAAGSILHKGCRFLDGIKIGLRIRPVGKILPNIIDISAKEAVETAEVDIRSIALKPGEFYLLQTLEEICLPDTIFGLLHTRSSVARLGLNCIGSSNYVAPGFGNGMPRSLVLEATSMKIAKNLSLERPLVGLILFEMPAPVRIKEGSINMFPFSPD